VVKVLTSTARMEDEDSAVEYNAKQSVSTDLVRINENMKSVSTDSAKERESTEEAWTQIDFGEVCIYVH
jgi:ribosomal silencing factor RsfS